MAVTFLESARTLYEGLRTIEGHLRDALIAAGVEVHTFGAHMSIWYMRLPDQHLLDLEKVEDRLERIQAAEAVLTLTKLAQKHNLTLRAEWDSDDDRELGFHLWLGELVVALDDDWHIWLPETVYSWAALLG